MKAWMGFDDWENLVNVFYAKTRRKAKQLVASEFDIHFTEAKVYRMKEADNLPRDKEWSYLIDWSNPDSAKVLRDNGLLEDEDLCCWHCGKGEFQALPESMLINGYCNDCRIELGYTQYLEELVEKGKR